MNNHKDKLYSDDEMTLLYGKGMAFPDLIGLKAGELTLLYGNGYIRSISYGEQEVIRMIYPAVRDEHWGTLQPEIMDESVNAGENSFHITYNAEYRQNDIFFRTAVEITGTNNSKIIFRMHGEALSTFKKNRIGLCVHHPIDGFAGNDCILMHPGGQNTTGRFPSRISPDAPFLNLVGMRWQMQGRNTFRLEFTGDIFETEDQRNWSDASYKTYSTPVSLPFPLEMKQGSVVDQSVTLVPEGQLFSVGSTHVSNEVHWQSTEKEIPFPCIGVARSSRPEPLTAIEAGWLRELNFTHYHVSISLGKENWQEDFKKANAEAKALKLPLQVALRLSANEKAELEEFIMLCNDIFPFIEEVMIFKEQEPVTPPGFLEALLPILRDGLHHVKLGVGTREDFVEINRHRPSEPDADFITFSLNPQVHASDPQTLVENIEGQKYIFESLHSFIGDKSIYVGPVRLKPADRDVYHAATDNPPASMDPRQASLFAAGWTTGTIKVLAESGATAITLFETVGEQGLLFGDHKSLFPGSFDSEQSRVFPVYYLLREVMSMNHGFVIACNCTQPLKSNALLLSHDNTRKLFIVNHTFEQLTTSVPGITGSYTSKILDLSSLKDAAGDPAYFSSLAGTEQMAGPEGVSCELGPCAIAILDFKQ
jgi:D-apionolactonase